MSVICIGGVCIPMSAFVPFIVFLLKPLYAYVLRLMAWIQGKPVDSKQTAPTADDGDSDDEDETDEKERAATTEENFIYLGSEKQWQELMEKESRPVVGYFTGSWCKPCRATTPHLLELSKQHRNVLFVSIDAAKFTSIHEEQEVFALPTIKVYKFGKVQDSTTGHDAAAITTLVAKAAA